MCVTQAARRAEVLFLQESLMKFPKIALLFALTVALISLGCGSSAPPEAEVETAEVKEPPPPEPAEEPAEETEPVETAELKPPEPKPEPPAPKPKVEDTKPVVIMENQQRDYQDRTGCRESARNRQELPGVRGRQVLRRHDFPPRHPGIHDPRGRIQSEHE